MRQNIPMNYFKRNFCQARNIIYVDQIILQYIKIYYIKFCSFRYLNNQFRRKYPIRINSLFNKFPFRRIDIISKIIKCFLILEFNTKKTKTYLKEEKNISVSLRE